MATQETPLSLMAKALDVNELWLAGYDMPMERQIEQKEIDGMELLFRERPQIYNVLKMLSALDDEQLAIIENLLVSFTKK